MKKYFITVLIAISYFTAYCQSLSMSTISCSASGNMNLSWTLGETVIFTGQSTQGYLTQGFEQPDSPSITLSVVGGGVYCAGDSIFFQISSSFELSTGNSFNVILSDANGNFNAAITIGVIAGNNGSGFAILPTNLVSGSAYLIHVVSTAPPLTSNNSDPITINALPSVTISTANSTVCQGNQVHLTATGADTYNWSNGISSDTLSFFATQDTTLSVIGTSSFGCMDSTEISITTTPTSTEICNNIDDDCDGLVDEGFDQDNDGVSTCQGDCDDTNPNVNTSATEICNTIDDDCDNLIDEDLDCETDLIIPNGISPNGDGANDTWIIQGLENYPDNEVSIVNRWGQELFHAKPYINDWDGKYQGNKLPSSDYYYVLQLSDSQIVKGFISVKE